MLITKRTTAIGGFLFFVAAQAATCETLGSSATSSELYTESGGPNPTFESYKFVRPTVNCNKYKPFPGSVIKVNRALVETGEDSWRPIYQPIRLHNLCESTIPRSDFHQYQRWYQEDGNTQIFRLFKGEENRRNDREGAARSEVFTTEGFKKGDGWQTFVARYTIISTDGGAIFQSKSNDHNWAVQIDLEKNGDIILDHRQKTNVVLAKNMVGKSFDLKVMDDGHDYKVYFNGKLIDSGFLSRPTGSTNFRWGIYHGEVRGRFMDKDMMIFISGATINPKGTNPNPSSIGNQGGMSSLVSQFVRLHSEVQGFRVETKFSNGITTDIEVFDLNGNAVLSQSDVANHQFVSVPQKGIYLARITQNHSHFFQKVMVR